MPQTPQRVISNGYIEQNQQAYQQNWQQHTPYGNQTPYGGMRHIEAPPPLIHTQSAPVLPMADVVEERASPRKRGLFR